MAPAPPRSQASPTAGRRAHWRRREVSALAERIFFTSFHTELLPPQAQELVTANSQPRQDIAELRSDRRKERHVRQAPDTRQPHPDPHAGQPLLADSPHPKPRTEHPDFQGPGHHRGRGETTARATGQAEPTCAARPVRAEPCRTAGRSRPPQHPGLSSCAGRSTGAGRPRPCHWPAPRRV